MKQTSILGRFLLAGITVAILWNTGSVAAIPPDTQARDSAQSEKAADNDTIRVAVPEVIAYYFHTTARCVSCKKIEAYSQEAIETGFAEELKIGKLKFESINIDEDANKHYAKDYQLYTKSLVICDMKDGKQVQWKNLAKVWELVGNKEAFIKYVQDEMRTYLKEN